MNEDRFVRARMSRWAELRDLIDQASNGGLRSLEGDEVRRMGHLYRAATADLALARTLGASADTLTHVNRLCAAGHDLIYARRTGGAGSRAVAFARGGFAALVRSTGRFHLVAGGAFALGVLAAYLVFRNDPALADRMLGDELRRRAERAATDATYIEIPGLVRPAFSWGIMTNNINVTLSAFALGAAGGVLGVLYLLWQGMFALGGVLAVFADRGVADVLITFAAAHGPIELTAIFIGAGAGLRTGVAPLLPGRLGRMAAFVATARESIALLGGACGMLVIAGLLEGFVSPSALPSPVKWSIGVLTIVALCVYFGCAGRASAAPQSPVQRTP